MAIVLTLIGIMLIGVALADVFQTLFHPAVHGALSDWIPRLCGRHSAELQNHIDLIADCDKRSHHWITRMAAELANTKKKGGSRLPVINRPFWNLETRTGARARSTGAAGSRAGQCRVLV